MSAGTQDTEPSPIVRHDHLVATVLKDGRVGGRTEGLEPAACGDSVGELAEIWVESDVAKRSSFGELERGNLLVRFRFSRK